MIHAAGIVIYTDIMNNTDIVIMYHVFEGKQCWLF